MRIRHVVLAAVTWSAVASAAWAEDSKEKARPITIIASPSTLTFVVGKRCHVELNAVTSGLKETVTTYDGVIADVYDQGIGLAVEEERRTVAVKTALAHKPFFDRLFRNVGIGSPKPSGKIVWLPSATIRSVRLIEGDAPRTLAPPTQQLKPISTNRPARLGS